MARIPIEVLLTAKDQATSTLSRLGGQLSKTGRDFSSFKRDVVVASAALTGAGLILGNFINRAANLELITNAFNTMTKNIDTDSDKVVAAVRKMTKNTVSQYDIIQKASLALNLIGRDAFGNFTDEFSQLATIASKASQATGEDINFMFDSIVRGIGRSSPLILDNLGLSIKLGDAYGVYAQQLGKSADELTAVEQKQALMNEVIRQGTEKYGEINIETENFAIRLQQLKVRLSETAIEIGQVLVPIVESLIDRFLSLNPETQRAIVIIGLLIPVVTALGVAAGALIGILTFLTSMVGVVVIAAVLAAIAVFASFKRWIKRVQQSIEVWKNVVSSAFEYIKNAVENFANKWIDRFNAIKNIVEGVANAIRNVIRAAEDLARKSLSGLHIPGFQTGGVVPGPVGAPRLAVVHGGEQVVPNSRGGGQTSGGGGMTFNVQIGLYAGTETEKRNIAQDLYAALVRVAQAQNVTVAEMLGG